MGLFDWLTKPTPGNTTQTTSTALSPDAQNLFSSAILPQIQQGAKPITPFSGPTVAGFNPNQVAGQNQVVGAAGQNQQLADAGSAAQKYFLDPSRMDVTNDPLIQNQANAVSQNGVQDFLQRILPGIRSGATQAGGAFSGANSHDAIAQGQAGGDASRYLQQTLATLYGGAYQNAAQRAQTAQGQNAQVMANATAPGIQQDAVGQAQQAQAQKELDAQISQYYMPYQLQQAQVTSLLQQLGLMPGSTTTSNATGTAPQGPLLTQLLGAAANVGSKIAMA